jgi:hypothetical protein
VGARQESPIVKKLNLIVSERKKKKEKEKQPPLAF